MTTSGEASAFSSALLSNPAGLAYHLSRGRWIPARHLRLISFHLARAIRGRDKRLIIATPPRHGKSLLTSVWTPVWALTMWPHYRVILTSYEATVATEWGRQVRNILDDHQDQLSVTLSKDSKAANRWNTSAGGGMTCAGVGGPIAGRGANLFLIDDPVKNAEEAHSANNREKKDQWFRWVAANRLEPDAAIVIIQTRWHEDDLAGRRLKATAKGDENWKYIRLPAIAEADDPLGRDVGEPLWPERYDVEALAEQRRFAGPYGFAALFQQSPQPAEGGIFREEWFKRRFNMAGGGLFDIPGSRSYVREQDLLRFVTVDPAIKDEDVTIQDAYTAILVFGIAPSGDLLLLDVVRDHLNSPDTVHEMKRLQAKWKPTAFWIEKVAYQSALIQWARKAGLPCRELDADKRKETRALGAAPSCEAKKVVLPHDAIWLQDFMSELLAAPTGTHWDQVDAFAYGVQIFDQHHQISWPPGHVELDAQGNPVGQKKERGAWLDPGDDYDADLKEERQRLGGPDETGFDRSRWRRQAW